MPCVLFLGLYVAMILLMQNQPRYQQIVAPATFMVFAIFLSSISIRIAPVLRYAVITVLFLAGSFLTFQSREESIAEGQDIVSLQEASSWMTETGNVVSIDVMPHNPSAYWLRPRDLLALRSDMLSEEKMQEAVLMFSPKYAVAKRQLPDTYLGVSLEFVAQVDTTIFDTLYFYKIFSVDE